MHKNKSGQALLIIMLAMATIATVVMSIVSRSISQVEVTNREEESLRAFSAAEAGIEEALTFGTIGSPFSDTLQVQTNQGGTADIGNYDAEITAFPNISATEYTYPFEMFSGESATVWLTNPSDLTDFFNGNSLDICWGEVDSGPPMSNTDPEAPALVLSFIYESLGNFYTATVPYDPNVARTTSNNFLLGSDTNCPIGDKTYSFSQTVSLNSFPSSPALNIVGKVRMLKVKMLYNENVAQTFGITALSGGIIPSQGKKVTSTGQSGSATRKIEAYLVSPSRPGIFDNVIYSPNSIIKP